MNILVIRRAYSDCPEHVAVLVTKSAEQVIAARYPGAVLDGCGGFDTTDGGSYLYDVCAGTEE